MNGVVNGVVNEIVDGVVDDVVNGVVIGVALSMLHWGYIGRIPAILSRSISVVLV